MMKVRELTTGLVDRLVLVDTLYVENSGKLSDITGLVTSAKKAFAPDG